MKAGYCAVLCFYFTCVLCCPLSMWCAVQRREDTITKPLLLLLNTVTVYDMIWKSYLSLSLVLIDILKHNNNNNLCIKSQ